MKRELYKEALLAIDDDLEDDFLVPWCDNEESEGQDYLKPRKRRKKQGPSSSDAKQYA